MSDKWRDYVVKKYVRARNASEAIELERGLPVCEVYDIQDKPATQNEINTNAVGFEVVHVDLA